MIQLYVATGDALAVLRRKNGLWQAEVQLTGLPTQCTVVISSEAHLAEHVGYKFDQAEKIVRDVGYRNRSTFTRRRRTEVAL